MTGRECSGNMRGLAECPQVTGEAPQRYLSGQLDPQEKGEI